MQCRVCNQETENKKYCSHKCQHTAYMLGKAEDIKLGSLKSIRTVKRYLIFTRGICCEICRLNTWQGKDIPLVMDHIDGNSDNWLESNLRLICPNCDAQTPTFKARNLGNGRHSRRKRYAEGKSY